MNWRAASVVAIAVVAAVVNRTVGLAAAVAVAIVLVIFARWQLIRSGNMPPESSKGWRRLPIELLLVGVVLAIIFLAQAGL